MPRIPLIIVCLLVAAIGLFMGLAAGPLCWSGGAVISGLLTGVGTGAIVGPILGMAVGATVWVFEKLSKRRLHLSNWT